MPLLIQEDEIFDKLRALPEGRTFEHCTFKNCDFANGNLSDIAFIDCLFEGCNLALANIGDAGLQNILFRDCKLTGLDFSKSREFAFDVKFERCLMDNTIFFKRKMKGGKFSECSLIEADFSNADLTTATFNNCNLQNTFFEKTILKQADLRNSYNYIIDPERTDIRKAKFSMYGLAGLLVKYDIKVE